MEYFFDGASAYKWQHPCVASISCEINTADQDEFENTKVLSAVIHNLILPFPFQFCPSPVVGDHGDRGGHRRGVRPHLLLHRLRLQALRVLWRKGKSIHGIIKSCRPLLSDMEVVLLHDYQEVRKFCHF